MRYARVAAVALFLLPVVLHADDATKRTKTEEMLTLSKVTSLSQQMLSSFPARVKELASRQPLVQGASTPEQKKITADYLQQMSDIAQKSATWESVHPKLVELYMNAFTEPELDGIIAFYKTAPGQALVAKTPELSGKTMELLQGTINSLGPDFKAATLAYQTNMNNTAPAPAQKAPTLGPPTLKPRQ